MTLDWAAIRGRLEAEGLLRAGEGERTGDLLTRFVGEVELWGSRTHLVGRTNREENILVSLLDSMHLLRLAERSGDLAAREGGSRAADIGSGAGFPGMIWAIARPDIGITLFERREKPRLFLERTAALLDLTGSVAVEGEAEPSEMGGSFDIAVSKAAGRLDVVAPIAAGLLRPGGVYATIKGEGWEEERQDMERDTMSFESMELLPGNRGSMLRFRKSSG